MKRICQHCNAWYEGTWFSRYCNVSCRVEAERTRSKIKRQWERTQQPLTWEQRRRELDEILGDDNESIW